MRPAKRIKKAKTRNSEEVLQRLQQFLEQDADIEELASILCGFWKDQQDAISYQELRQIVMDGTISKEMLDLWSQDYSRLVVNTLSNTWMTAARAGVSGQVIMDNIHFEINMQKPGILNWLSNRGAEFVTSCTEEQKKALGTLLTRKMMDNHTVDELSRRIRPCIGLTEGQAKANTRFYNHMVETFKKEHPRMKEENIRKKAQEAAIKYAERQHRYRAMTIAQTESAFAYNRGADEGIRQAQEQKLIGKVIKRWSTSGDDQVCSICQGLEGIEVEMDKGFPFKGKSLFPGQDLLPPAHPRCACAVEYIEVEQPVYMDIPQMAVDITQEDSLRKYSTEEIEDIARQTEDIVSRHISTPSMWSGKMVVSDEGIKNSDGHITYYGKPWNCDILTKHKTAPSMIMHEQIHARSISHYGQEIFIQFSCIEEAAVQFMTEELCRKAHIEIIESDYYFLVDSLKQLGQYIGIHKTDYDFAKFMIEMPVVERLDWISEHLYDTLRKNTGATVEDYQHWYGLLDRLYAKE